MSQVESYRSLGSLVDEDGRCDKEIKVRIEMINSSFEKMRKLLTNLSLNRQLRKKDCWKVMFVQERYMDARAGTYPQNCVEDWKRRKCGLQGG